MNAINTALGRGTQGGLAAEAKVELKAPVVQYNALFLAETFLFKAEVESSKCEVCRVCVLQPRRKKWWCLIASLH